jgi:hypothetical protein
LYHFRPCPTPFGSADGAIDSARGQSARGQMVQGCTISGLRSRTASVPLAAGQTDVPQGPDDTGLFRFQPRVAFAPAGAWTIDPTPASIDPTPASVPARASDGTTLYHFRPVDTRRTIRWNALVRSPGGAGPFTGGAGPFNWSVQWDELWDELFRPLGRAISSTGRAASSRGRTAASSGRAAPSRGRAFSSASRAGSAVRCAVRPGGVGREPPAPGPSTARWRAGEPCPPDDHKYHVAPPSMEGLPCASRPTPSTTAVCWTR